MRAVIQRVRSASVQVDHETLGEIGHGLLVYLGVGHGDDETTTQQIVQKIVNLRIFPDEDGKMNRSILEAKGEMLVISQFTLYADIRKGRRPSFTDAASPEEGNRWYERFLDLVHKEGVMVAAGRFQAHMIIKSENDGPVTIWIDSSTLPKNTS